MSVGSHPNLKRAAGFFRTLVKNRMALIGLVLLFGSIFIAAAAPILTPYKPKTDIVAGTLAEPVWIMNFQDGYYLSQNIVLVNDPSFNAAGAVQEWNVSAPSTILSNLVVSYAPGVNETGGPPSRGSLQLRYSGSGPATVTISKTFYYPYHGPPKKFLGKVSASLLSNTSLPVQERIFIDRVNDQVFNLYSQNLTVGGKWLGAYLDSDGQLVTSAIGATGAAFTPATIIFSAQQKYTYGISVTFNGPETLYFDNIQLKLYGTAFGLLGTDNTGRDIFTWLVYGSQVSLYVGLVAAGIGIGLGLVIGLLAGYLGKVVDEILMRFTDMLLTIPGLPLLLVLVAVIGNSETNIIIVIGFLGWMGFARIIRSQVLSLRERPFIEASKAAGAGPFRIMARHIFPNIVGLTYVNLALTVPGAILSEAALAFLGLGDPTIVSWGQMFRNAELSQDLFDPWWVIPPGIAIALVSLSFILIGYALDEIFNPKLRKRR
jgi:peptide/nickel transport system permease protein